MTESRGIQIFLAHASGDKAAVLSLYERLKEQGYSPWLDKKNLLPGQNWRTEIPKAIKSCDVFIACLSPRSVNKDGYIQQELRLALMECAEKSSDSLYLIPLRLEACEIPDLQLPHLGVNLRDYHWLDYWEVDSFDLLVQSIEYGREVSATPSPAPTVTAPSPSPAPPAAVSPPDSPPAPSKGKLHRFSFEVVTVDAKGQERDRRSESGDHFLEELGDGVFLDMVRIPGGEFLMGSPEDEPDRQDTEGPQHRVIVPEFFMGRCPVTQSQWRVVAGLEQVNRRLKSSPSRFKGDDRPVECVSWPDAVEFCDRISVFTGQQYRLPSESEWEYACRAGTISPFHFGSTLTSAISNYRSSETYGDEPKGEYRKETTEVGEFPANGFGVYDMHGNVREWCQDHWHGSYDGAPSDGSAWIGNSKYRVLRSGSWISDPRNCRSARRDYFRPDSFFNFIGFRVACASPRAL